MTEKKAFDPTKPVTTRDGRPVRILCTDRTDDVGRPIVALVTRENGRKEDVCYYKADGTAYDSHLSVIDLVNVPERKVYTRFIGGEQESFYTALRAPEGCRGALDFITEDGELVDVVFRKKGE